MFQACAESCTLEGVAMEAAMILPALLLQKPHFNSKSKEHVKHLERRLSLWKDGDLDISLDEGRTIQGHLKTETNRRNITTDQLSRKFTKFMMGGKVRPALRIIADDNMGQQLHLDSVSDSNNPSESVYDTLRKHPPRQPLKADTIVN